MKIRFICLILLLIISCNEEKKAVLLADREAPLGWILDSSGMTKMTDYFSIMTKNGHS